MRAAASSLLALWRSFVSGCTTMRLLNQQRKPQSDKSLPRSAFHSVRRTPDWRLIQEAGYRLRMCRTDSGKAEYHLSQWLADHNPSLNLSCSSLCFWKHSLPALSVHLPHSRAPRNGSVFSVCAIPVRQPLRLEATGVSMEITKCLKPSSKACHTIL